MSEKNSNRDIAVKVSGVKKMYKLGQIGGGTLQKDLQSWWARVRGKEDPNSKIGADQRSYGDTFMALNGVDLTIYQGEAVGIIGSNGAGKSTLLKLLSRVTAPTQGDIDIYGRIASMLEVGTGFNGELTGRENVYMNGAILGMTKAEIDAKMEDIIEFSEVREFIDTPVKRYSSGMFVKLAFSVAAHLDAEIMIMDEVLAVGDMAFQIKCLDKMKDVATKDGRTVLYVSHNMNTIRRLCDRCIVLDKGRVIFDGKTSEAIEIYLNLGKIEFKDFDYSKYKREDWVDFDRIRISKINPNCDNSSNVQFFTGNKPIKFGYSIDAKENLDKIGILMEIIDEFDSPIGAIPMYNVKLNKGINNFTSKYEFGSLLPGKYKCNFTVFSLASDGRHILEDGVPGFKFEIVDAEGDISVINWNKSVIGSVKISEAIVD